jgi:predicted transcriptional regulator
MTKDVTISARIDRKLSERLARGARQVKRSKSSLVALAIENYLEIQAQDLALIKYTRDAVRAGEPTVPNEEVMRWLKSWGTENELPMPSARRRTKHG